MSLKDLIEAMSLYVVDLLTRRFTGKVVFTINVRDGGVGNVNVIMEQTLGKKERLDNSTPQ